MDSISDETRIKQLFAFCFGSRSKIFLAKVSFLEHGDLMAERSSEIHKFEVCWIQQLHAFQLLQTHPHRVEQFQVFDTGHNESNRTSMMLGASHGFTPESRLPVSVPVCNELTFLMMWGNVIRAISILTA